MIIPQTISSVPVNLKRARDTTTDEVPPLPTKIKCIRNEQDSSIRRKPSMPSKEPSQTTIKLGESAKSSEPKSVTVKQLVKDIAKQTGIVESHLEPLQELAKDTNQIISFRPVDQMSTGLIEKGYPTKGFEIKGKSANHGPQAGFICVKQELSKLHRAGLEPKVLSEKVKKYNGEVQSCIEKRDAIPVQLKLSPDRLKWLSQNGTITFPVLSTSLDSFMIRSEGLTYQADRKGNDFVISYNDKPLEVLADPKSNMPLTADYDLMFIAPQAEQLDVGKEDKVPVPRIHFGDISQAYKDKYEKDNNGRPFTPAEFFAKENETQGSWGQGIGNATPRINKMIDSLNLATVGKGGNPVVHHNADSGSPATDPSSNYPITVFMPKAFDDYQSIHIIKDTKELAEFVKKAKDAGFSVPLNPKWEKPVAQARSARFTDAQNTILNWAQETHIPNLSEKTSTSQ
ncbi:anthrax toxin-like adenylyl cyclase domain-containing protein [Vibrio sagamiensis]|uniref:Anthrax toxin edema factor central domain-containing protein n=1 Tax=Vibrio sagamiensis NBRC 104589 TaxID=1219064 RepID=A0A511QJP2_9VIBR|nr:anthrax toxin-like adenylyl cyclase domain-containing protein [Vibrio sagamiensis]PNQ55259.1 adenylate cyclase [Vibrio agarivorans]GEM77417.1 hypothetical protein VSA01S_35290 [Vibrio sagamiensis NBRC 104589]